MKKINVNIPQKNYNIFIGENIFGKAEKLLKKEKVEGNIFLVIDRNVNRFYSKKISSAFGNIDYKKIIITANEKNKSYATLQKIHKALIKNNYGRDSVLVAIGGGITGDITGFAAATYMRGIKYIQIPTTLLASVDSSVGGKTGINFFDTKNIIGSFHQPEFVLIDTNFFKTLPEEEILCGIGEITKYAFLTEDNFFNYIKRNLDNLISNNNSVIKKVISESIKFKSDVVTADEKERGIRKILNFGHTFAHALEMEQKHKLKHGQAVIVGISSALYLSNRLGLLAEKDFEKYSDLLLHFANKIKLKKSDTANIYKIMLRDKKNRQKEIKFVLLKSIGNIVTEISAPKKNILDAIKYGTELFG